MKRGLTFHLGMITIGLLMVALLLTYLWLAPPTHPYVIKEQEGTLINPVLALTDSQALADFDSKYVFFLLYYAHAYSLHNPPLSTAHPHLVVALDGVTYHAEIVDGIIQVRRGTFATPDITIHSTKQELIRILRNPDLIAGSFTQGTSTIDVHVSHATLFSKGYLHLYTQLFDSGIASNALRIAGS